jgi:hypothetical protein
MASRFIEAPDGTRLAVYEEGNGGGPVLVMGASAFTNSLLAEATNSFEVIVIGNMNASQISPYSRQFHSLGDFNLMGTTQALVAVTV